MRWTLNKGKGKEGGGEEEKREKEKLGEGRGRREGEERTEGGRDSEGKIFGSLFLLIWS